MAQNETSMQRAMREAGVKSSKYSGSQKPNQKNSLQNNFLSDIVKSKNEVEINTVDGKSLKGHVLSYDDFSLLFENQEKSKKQLVFKHSIQSINTT